MNEEKSAFTFLKVSMICLLSNVDGFSWRSDSPIHCGSFSLRLTSGVVQKRASINKMLA